MSFAAIGKTIIQGIKAGRTVVAAGGDQALFTFKHLKDIGKAGSLANRLGFSAKMGGRVARETYRTLSPAAQQALNRTAAGTAAGTALVTTAR